mgnify:CR=1 FL=1|jgi:hypothetical protein
MELGVERSCEEATAFSSRRPRETGGSGFLCRFVGRYLSWLLLLCKFVASIFAIAARSLDNRRLPASRRAGDTAERISPLFLGQRRTSSALAQRGDHLKFRLSSPEPQVATSQKLSGYLSGTSTHATTGKLRLRGRRRVRATRCDAMNCDASGRGRREKEETRWELCPSPRSQAPQSGECASKRGGGKNRGKHHSFQTQSRVAHPRARPQAQRSTQRQQASRGDARRRRAKQGGGGSFCRIVSKESERERKSNK